MRLRRLEEEFAGVVEFEWRSYLLRPHRREHTDREAALEKFRAYTRSWLRPATDDDAGDFHANLDPGADRYSGHGDGADLQLPLG